MNKVIAKVLFGLTLLGSMAFSAAPSWTDAENLAVYWFESEGTELERGTEIRPDAATSGTVAGTEDDFERATGLWIPSLDDDFYLNTSNGTWMTDSASYTYSITTTTNTNDTLVVPDGEIKLTDVVNIEGQTEALSECFDIDVTFSPGATRYAGEWKDTEIYELWWIPSDWQTSATYPTLDAFVNADQPFLWNQQSGENAGFRLDANLSDGSGDLVKLTWDGNTFSEGAPVGTWNTFTLPGQVAASIKLNITDPEFTDDDADYQFATVKDATVWIGAHKSDGEWENIEDDGFVGNQVAYDDFMNAMAPYDFKKLVNCDFVDKKVVTAIGPNQIETYFYGNMNFISLIETTPGYWMSAATGEWSVENGVIVSDVVRDDVNKTVTVHEINFQNLSILHTVTGRGTLQTQEFQYISVHELPETAIPHRLSVEDVKGKKINVTYEEAGESPDTGNVFLFENMTFSFEDSGEDVGVWKVENGVLVLDTYWQEGGSVETGVESWVFNDAAHADVYLENEIDANITIHSIVDINSSSDSIPDNFSSDPIAYAASAAEMAGKKVVIGDASDPMDQDTIYFYENMTYKQETHDDDGNPETITGAWSVEEGVVIVDVVYSDNESAHYVIIFNEAPAVDETFTFMEVVSNGTEREEGIQIVSISDIPEETENSGVSPAVIMYLLN